MRGGSGVRKENDVSCLMNEHTNKNKNMSEQLYTQQHNRVCKVTRSHIWKNFDVPVPENLWEHEPKGITENIEVRLTYDLMIPSGVNIENEPLRPDIILRCKKNTKRSRHC